MKIHFKYALPFLLLLFYLFCSTFLTRILFPFQTRGWIGDIDPSPLHIPLYVLIGFYFRWWTFLFAIGGEFLQMFIPGKYFDWKDVAFNYMGAAIGILLWRMTKDAD